MTSTLRQQSQLGRRHFRAGGGADPFKLISDLGGDAAITALYDGRYNVTVDGSKRPTKWQDVRIGTPSSAFAGPDLNINGGNGFLNNAWDNNGLSQVVGAGKDQLVSGLSSVFDRSVNYTLFVVATFSATDTGNSLGVVDGAAPTRELSINPSNGNIRGFYTTVPAVIDSLQARSGTPRCVIIFQNTTGPVGSIQVVNAAAQTGAPATPAAGTNQMVVFALTPGTSAAGAGPYFTIGWLPRVPSAGDLATINAYASQRGATLL